MLSNADCFSNSPKFCAISDFIDYYWDIFSSFCRDIFISYLFSMSGCPSSKLRCSILYFESGAKFSSKWRKIMKMSIKDSVQWVYCPVRRINAYIIFPNLIRLRYLFFIFLICIKSANTLFIILINRSWM